jgi:hypothetical protein
MRRAWSERSAYSRRSPTARRPYPRRPGIEDADGRVWATPALHGDHLYVPTHSARLLVVELADGTVVSNEFLGGPLWSSPAIVEEPCGPA